MASRSGAGDGHGTNRRFGGRDGLCAGWWPETQPLMNEGHPHQRGAEHVTGDEHRWDAREVLQVAQARLGDEHRHENRGRPPGRDRAGAGRASRASSRRVLARNTTMAMPCRRTTSRMSIGSRSASGSPPCGPAPVTIVPVMTTIAPATSSHRPSGTNPGAAAGRRAAATAHPGRPSMALSGQPARS